jgi:hypothetical protein
VAAQIDALGAKSLAVDGDVRDENDMIALVEAAVNAFGRWTSCGPRRHTRARLRRDAVRRLDTRPST